MAKFRNVRLKKRGGGTRLQRAQVLASGKLKFVKNLTSSKSSSKGNPKSKTKSKTKKSGKYMAKKKRRSRKFTIPLAPVIGLAAGMTHAIPAIQAGNFGEALNQLSYAYTGYSPTSQIWSMEGLKRGLLPLVAGCLVHKFVGGAPLNLNRVLASANVPLIRI